MIEYKTWPKNDVRALRKSFIQSEDWNARGYNGETILHVAASHGSREVLELLLLHDEIDLSLRDKRGRTAFDLAKTANNRRILDILLQHEKSYSVPIPAE